MKPLWIIAVIAMMLSMSPTQASEPTRTQSHATREQALALLTREGFYHPNTHRVLSATWHQNIQEWLITLKLRDGTETHWFVDSQAQHCSGGTCRH